MTSNFVMWSKIAHDVKQFCPMIIKIFHVGQKLLHKKKFAPWRMSVASGKNIMCGSWRKFLGAKREKISRW